MIRQSALVTAATVVAASVLLAAQVPTQSPAPAPQAVAPGQGDSKGARVADQPFVMDAASGGNGGGRARKTGESKSLEP